MKNVMFNHVFLTVYSLNVDLTKNIRELRGQFFASLLQIYTCVSNCLRMITFIHGISIVRTSSEKNTIDYETCIHMPGKRLLIQIKR